MENNITDIIKKAKELSLHFKKEINNIQDTNQIDLLKTKYMGKKGLFTALLRSLSSLNNEQKALAGKALNVIKKDVEKNINFHKEVLQRNSKFKSAPYSGFVNPVLVPSMNDAGEIESFSIEQPASFEEQMLMYSKNYSNLPTEN